MEGLLFALLGLGGVYLATRPATPTSSSGLSSAELALLARGPGSATPLENKTGNDWSDFATTAAKAVGGLLSSAGGLFGGGQQGSSSYSGGGSTYDSGSGLGDNSDAGDYSGVGNAWGTDDESGLF